MPDDPATASASSALSASLGRSVSSTVVLAFSRPIRLFRPTKISAFTALEALAKQHGAFSARIVYTLAKSEGFARFFLKHVLPPFAINAVVGFALFGTYTFSETALSPLLPSWSVPAISGALAGLAQSVFSSPLDNLRFVIQSRAKANAKWAGWPSVLREAIRPQFLQAVNHPSTSKFTFLREASRFSSRGWSMFALSSARDVIGFSVFFSIFEMGRETARTARLWLDEQKPDLPNWLSRTFQAVVIIASGSAAGVAYALVGRPLDVSRGLIYEERMRWANDWKAYYAKPGQSKPASSLPSAITILKNARQKEGLWVFTGRPNSKANHPVPPKISNHPALLSGSDDGNEVRRNIRKLAVRQSVFSRVFRYIPPYSIGFLAYAVLSGDLH